MLLAQTTIVHSYAWTEFWIVFFSFILQALIILLQYLTKKRLNHTSNIVLMARREQAQALSNVTTQLSVGDTTDNILKKQMSELREMTETINKNVSILRDEKAKSVK